jgi:hypothetical protein
MTFKRLSLIVASAMAFLVGYGAAAQAWPGVPDRIRLYGYFLNQFDNNGDDIFAGGYPLWVDSPAEFISFTKGKFTSSIIHERVGAAFIIQTMLGDPWSRNNPPTAAQIADWESRVYRAGSFGISWNADFNYTANSFWQGGSGGPNDDAFYDESGIRRSLIFRNSAGQVVYVIKRDCANPLTGPTNPPGLEESWSSTGWTNAPATAIPDQLISFEHFVQNTGQTTALIWYATLEGSSSAGTGLPQRAGNNITAGGQTINVADESFRIPINAAAGTRYCRLIGWDPVNSAGGRNGRGAQRCVTVVIPAKLQAAMSVSPSTMAPGDTTNFTPAISATSNASPITVNCSITRTLYPPSGASSSLGSQPCVTTSGSANIVIGSGASVSLRPNSYTAADTVAVGTRVCDVITITNPAGAGYYDDPADRTAEACVRVAKTPYVHFMGGDVWAGGGFASVSPGTCNNPGKITTVTRARALAADGSTPGSGTTYAAFALGKITTFGSGGMAQVTATGVGDNWTFANTNTSNLGFFNSGQHCIPDYSGFYTSAPTLPGNSVINVGTQPSGAWHVTGVLRISGTMPAGSRQVYLVDGDVDIDNVLKYPDTFASAADIPSLVIISRHNFHIFAAATQVDGILQAVGNGTTTGIFRTCWPRLEPATITTCPATMRINGSVMAAALDLFRTAGADGTTPATQKAPAEVFNLSPEVYISNALNQTSQPTITTSQVRELPPRF